MIDDVLRMFEAEARHAEAYCTEVLGEDCIVLPSVFSPEYRSNTRIYTALLLPHLAQGSSLLDMGCGTGITGVLAAKKGVIVSASDVQQRAVENVRANAALHNVPIDVRQGSLFEPWGGCRFDSIYWNHPWRDQDYPEAPFNNLGLSYDPEYALLGQFLRKTPYHLNPGGNLFLGTGSLANLERVNELLAESHFRIALKESAVGPLGTGPDGLLNRVETLLIQCQQDYERSP